MSNSITDRDAIYIPEADIAAKPGLFTDHVKQTAVGVFLGMTAWSVLGAIVYVIVWLLR